MDSGPELEKALLTIDISRKYDLAMLLVEATVPIWENYAKDPESLSYMDGVGGIYKIEYRDSSGNFHSLEKDIVIRAIQIIKEGKVKAGDQATAMIELCNKLKAHIDAVDIWDDWQPEEMEFTLYANYYFLQLYLGAFKEEEGVLNRYI